MARSNTILIIAGVIGVAAAAGFGLQALNPGYGAQAAQQTGQAAPSMTATDMLTAPTSEPRLEISGITLTSSLPAGAAPTSIPLTAPKTAPDRPVLAAADTDSLPQAGDCPVTLSAEPTIAALVALSFQARCAPYAPVTFAHEGMTFRETTNSTGRIAIAVPALAENARFVATLDDGAGAEAAVPVSSLIFYDRAVLATPGPSGLSLHALEFTSDHADAGHVWSGAPRDPSIAARGEGGFLLVLGDPALDDAALAEVYTFPSGTARTAGDIALSVEAEVLDTTCGTPVSATVLQVTGGARVKRQHLALTMPACDAVGDLLLLKTPLDDLKIASR
ncbi:hypothetical protein [Pseudooceanicola sp. LIPI14-2-Ac024]|uniref:hypothetical protein n=1 Tax=Pseudooceanicola sp. LIPI14-2-Ac024 TaxID=3344875 RepID=UPI0035CF0375